MEGRFPAGSALADYEVVGVGDGLVPYDGKPVPKGPVADGVQPQQTETLYFGDWTGEGPPWDGWVIEPAAAAGLRVARDATDAFQPVSAPESAHAVPSESPPHGYKGAAGLVADPYC